MYFEQPTRSAPSPPRGARGKGSRSPCYCESVFDSVSQVDVLRTTHSVSPLSPRGGEGEREPISMLLRICIRLGISGRCTSNNPLGQSPLPQGGEGKGSRSPCYCESVFDSISQVDVLRTTHSVSPLSLWERVRVRAAAHPKAPPPWSAETHNWPCLRHWSNGYPTHGWCGQCESAWPPPSPGHCASRANGWR
ncbi:hypothetical protein PS896_04396 [Pseudomonas fluorescens]|uniref:Uncharacterized protein n=1 Tax=Pseudomonas fluorescens TaxID=294 RepID=A0A5E7N446_PSEFL|nr:hypothetical protein PS896_04396 [Pseudomonas fluorescens]